ncbi:ATP-binding protein [Roseiconus lacunae]|uniref:sensor histidine kinase n=1 Tax=Roseiconus lacunae TaxID=2605694 RepID=UPI0030909F9B|nr:ATP-binding protein [Stieleria sp. HD01]
MKRPTQSLFHETVTVLLLDDDMVDRRLIRRLLKHPSDKYRVVEFDKIEPALEAAKKTPFDCAIVDYNIGGHDGITVVRSLHKILPYLPAIMVTGQGDEKVARQALLQGLNDYVRKDDLEGNTFKQTIDSAIQKRQLQKTIEDQHRYLSEFSHILTRDISAPVDQITTLAQSLLDDAAIQNDPQNKQIVGQIQQAGAYLNDLIRALHGYNSGIGGIVSKTKVNLTDAVDSAISNLNPMILVAGGDIQVATLPEVFGSAPLLTQLFQNLIENSVKFRSEAGVSIQITGSVRENLVVLSVADDGIGIEEADRARIFRPFCRLHGNRFGGPGLGLATCQRIVDAHGGRIWCEPNSVRGTIFMLELPLY